jgi:hypothetical protein
MSEAHHAGFWDVTWKKMREEPAQAAALAYFWLVCVGFAHLFGTGFAFDINVIDLASPADFLVAGLRDPFVTLMGAVTGLALYTLWGRWRGKVHRLWLLAILAVLSLALCAVLSAMYRHAVVAGPARLRWGAPHPLKIAKGDEIIDCARIGVTTSDFIVVEIDPAKAKDSSHIHVAVARHEIKGFEIREPSDCARP